MWGRQLPVEFIYLQLKTLQMEMVRLENLLLLNNKVKNMLRRSIVLIIMIMPTFLFSQQYERPGSATCTFLNIGVSPRAAGMGDSYFAVANGAEAVYYNPAILANLKGLNVSANHNEWFANISHDFLALAQNFNNLGALGVSLTYLSTDEMNVTTPLQPEGTGETFYSTNYRIGLSYARGLTNYVSFGGSVYYIKSSLYDTFEQSAVSGDISVIYVTDFRNFRFGMKIANFGSSITYVNEQYPLPINFIFGMAINVLQSESQTVLLCATGMKPSDDQTLTRAGLEWSFKDFLFIRGGYKFNDDIATYSFGAGFKVGIERYQLRIDYAYSEYGLLGVAHRFGFNFVL
ncbi:PorV/PorQ family protein [candidate division KSB1 bacterium]|nr:PorV/PorQ family protein [candidate division KSB1 bacterium]